MTPTRQSASSPVEQALLIARLLASERRPMGRSEIIDGLGLHHVTPLTVTRWLEQARSRGWIAMNGATRGALYEAAPQFRVEQVREMLQTPARKRPKVGYNDDWLASYRPNETFYLSSDSRERLHRRSTPGHVARGVMGARDVRLFLCDLSFSSSKLEGNEYDYASTVRLFDEALEMKGGSETDRVMLLNHYEAVKFMLEWAHGSDSSNLVGQDQRRLTAYEIRAIHSLLSADLLTDPRMCGRLRANHVEICDSSYVPLDIPDAISHRFDIVIGKASQIEDPFEQAFFLLAHLPYLQPFEDCNKRTSRVSCNLPLLRAGVMPMSWMDTPHKDYIDGILAVYEANETALLEEVFVDGYLRATERFEIAQRAREPSPVALRYRQEIRKAVNERVLHDSSSMPESVAPRDAAAFMLHVESLVRAIKDSPIVGLRYGLRDSDVHAWIERTRSHDFADHVPGLKEDEHGHPSERCRA